MPRTVLARPIGPTVNGTTDKWEWRRISVPIGCVCHVRLDE
jgi:hypothetical protein